MSGRIQRLVGTMCLASVVLGVAAESQAAQSITAGKNKCTVTSLAPTLNGTTLTAKASVLCTVSSSVAVEVGVVELDGSAEDAKVVIGMRSIAVTVSANKAATVTTASVSCVNTETGNEEYATKALVNISGTVSAYDRTVPKTDAFAC